MLIPNQFIYRVAAFSLALFGLYVFLKGININEYKVLEDGSLVETSDANFVCFRHPKSVLTFRSGFDIYHSFCFGLASLFLLLDQFLNSGHLTFPALALAAGEIANDVSDFCVAVVLIAIYIGKYPAAAYGLTYLALLVAEVAIWLGTCKFHGSCRLANFEKKLMKKTQQEMNPVRKKVS